VRQRIYLQDASDFALKSPKAAKDFSVILMKAGIFSL
jgi:hypothetical protein